MVLFVVRGIQEVYSIAHFATQSMEYWDDGTLLRASKVLKDEEAWMDR